MGFRVLIPTRKHWLVILFLGVWLCGWAAAEVAVIRQLLRPGGGPPVAFLLFWLTGWTLGGGWALGTLLWQLAGREILSVENGQLIYRIELFSLSRTREFAGDQIARLRAVDYAPNLLSQQAAWMPPLFGSGMGPIAFDYGAKSYRVGQSLDESEAPKLVEMLLSRLPGRG
jgi:hypothetical protein